MEKLRKVLVWLFGSLSVIFACLALVRHFSESDGISPICPKQASLTANWGKSLESLARKEGRLIFFYDSKIVMPVSDKYLKDVLSRHYISVKVDFSRWPADYFVLDNLFFSNGGGKSKIKMGVLSPKMAPLFLSADISELRQNTPPLSSILAAIAKKYGDSNAELRKRAESSIDNASQNIAILRVRSTIIGEASLMSSECLSLYSAFSSLSASRAPAGLLSENARLAARIERLSPSPISRRNADMAALVLTSKMDDSDEPLTSKMLYARAVSEILSSGCGKEAEGQIKKFSDALLSILNSGKFLRDDKSEAPRVIDNALAVSILAREFIRTKDVKYLSCARSCAESLLKLSSSGVELPSVMDTEGDSQASSLEYALVSSAFADMHAATGDKSWLSAAKATLENWDSRFSLNGGICSVNSSLSPLSSLMRPILFDDGNLPSYLGEAAQVSRYLSSRGMKTRCTSNLEKLAELSCMSGPMSGYSRASLKLARLSSF